MTTQRMTPKKIENELKNSYGFKVNKNEALLLHRMGFEGMTYTGEVLRMQAILFPSVIDKDIREYGLKQLIQLDYDKEGKKRIGFDLNKVEAIAKTMQEMAKNKIINEYQKQLVATQSIEEATKQIEKLELQLAELEEKYDRLQLENENHSFKEKELLEEITHLKSLVALQKTTIDELKEVSEKGKAENILLVERNTSPEEINRDLYERNSQVEEQLQEKMQDDYLINVNDNFERKGKKKAKARSLKAEQLEKKFGNFLALYIDMMKDINNSSTCNYFYKEINSSKGTYTLYPIIEIERFTENRNINDFVEELVPLKLYTQLRKDGKDGSKQIKVTLSALLNQIVDITGYNFTVNGMYNSAKHYADNDKMIINTNVAFEYLNRKKICLTKLSPYNPLQYPNNPNKAVSGFQFAEWHLTKVLGLSTGKYKTREQMIKTLGYKYFSYIQLIVATLQKNPQIYRFLDSKFHKISLNRYILNLLNKNKL